MKKYIIGKKLKFILEGTAHVMSENKMQNQTEYVKIGFVIKVANSCDSSTIIAGTGKQERIYKIIMLTS